MSLAILVDMNLSAEWLDLFTAEGWECLHGSVVGDPRAPDAEIMNWARANRYVVFTHDLDFGAALAVSRADGPSVIQLRSQAVLPEHGGALVVAAIRQYDADLERGALIVIESARSRVRVLPLK